MSRITEMFKAANYISEFVSISVMLLMAVALIAGQANATVKEAQAAAAMEFHQVIEDRFSIDFEGHLGATAVKITVGVAAELSQIGAEND